MCVVVKKKTTFDMVEYTGVKSIAFDGTTYTLTKSDNTTVTYAAVDYLIWMVN